LNNYVVAAYAISALILGWDYLSPRIKLGRARRAIRLRERRDAARKPA